jgi:hypothetical protein
MDMKKEKEMIKLCMIFVIKIKISFFVIQWLRG